MLLNLKKHQQPDIKDPFELKYQFHINGKEKVRIKKLKNPKALIDYSQTIKDVYENLKDYHPMKKRRVLIVSDDMIAGTEDKDFMKLYKDYIRNHIHF